jgi:hypothetical protein
MRTRANTAFLARRRDDSDAASLGIELRVRTRQLREPNVSPLAARTWAARFCERGLQILEHHTLSGDDVNALLSDGLADTAVSDGFSRSRQRSSR